MEVKEVEENMDAHSAKSLKRRSAFKEYSNRDDDDDLDGSSK